MSESEKNAGGKALSKSEATELVTRSDVPPGKPYTEYKEYLRPDFFFSCAYCTIAEAEAQAVRFTIDHYEPQRARPDLVNVYDNLMYACDQCNTYKGPRSPTDAHREKGYRFFRPDRDVYADHFEDRGRRLEHKTPVGYFSINGLNLNRQALMRLRDIRRRASECDEFVLGGIRSLRTFKIDQIPPNIRGRASLAIKQALDLRLDLVAKLDAILKESAKSPFIDPDQDAKEHARERSAKLRQLESQLVPGRLKSVNNR